MVHSEGLEEEAIWVLASTCWIACWWITEAVPIPITSLMPLILFPLSEAVGIKPTAQAYISPILFIFIGGFILALALEKWNLHRRIALNIIASVGTQPRKIILGFMLASAFLSMWISNTATTLMMIPIALAIVQQMEMLTESQFGKTEFATVIILCIAYSASIGGIATLVGTPTNLIFTGFVEDTYGEAIAFDDWIVYGLPISLLVLVFGWLYLTYGIFRFGKTNGKVGKTVIRDQLTKLGPMSWEEKKVLIIFGSVALGWMTQRYLLAPWLPGIHDAIIALIGVVLLFILPGKNQGETLMDWKTASKLPWGIILLFGGAFALSKGFETTGLTKWMAEQFELLAGAPLWLILLLLIVFVNFLTEITMNMATCTLMMPVLAALGPALGIHPYGLMASTCVAASCAFMLPFATAPNAIAFGTERIKMREMIRAGFGLNLMSIAIIWTITYFFLDINPTLFGNS
ncbi:UNVERIFIED_CONTAM: hypothetical protein GTU68_036637 [Idotea baltica]|nr:hypothetical protein [Idotea baltica]